MTSSAFDPTAFEAQTSNESLSTSVTPVPENTYPALIKDYKFREYTNSKTQEKGVSCDISYTIIDDTGALRELLGRDPIVTHGYFCDTVMDPNTGKQVLDFGKGKNVWLGKIREAIGQNVPGQPWSLPMIKGAPILIVVIQDPSKTNDDIYNRVKSVGKMA
jgi:hypothetical protein